MTASRNLNVLISTNVCWLRQARETVVCLGDCEFASAPAGFEPHRVGSHLRHVLEFYICFLEGLQDHHIDYDARRRDVALETERAAAIAAIDRIIAALETCPILRNDSILWVRMEDAGADNGAEPFLASSVGRELQVLSSHTIHHFALIAVTLRLHGIPVDPDFGVAPSTLRHRERLRCSEAA